MLLFKYIYRNLLKGPLALLHPPPSLSFFCSESDASSSITPTAQHPNQNKPIHPHPNPILDNMSQDASGIPVHPIAPRLTNGPKTPHIGPNVKAYHAAHAETVGHESDHWWAKVCAFSLPSPYLIHSDLSCSPFPRRPCSLIGLLYINFRLV